MPSVDVIYSEWGSVNRATSLREILRCVATSKATIRHIVIVDNRLECAPYTGKHAASTTVVAGDNSSREFSGWDVGLHSIEGRADVLLFANDTFATHRLVRLTRRWRIARWIQLVAQSSGPEMFGQIDPVSPHKVTWLFGVLSSYISSYVFGMNASAADLLLPLTAIDADVETMLSPHFSADGLFSRSVPKGYRELVEGWLFTPGQWRNATPLSAENFDFFRLKAKSIIYEHALTCRAEGLGILVSDIFTGRGQADKVIARVAKAWMTQTRALNQSFQRALIGRQEHAASRTSAHGAH